MESKPILNKSDKTPVVLVVDDNEQNLELIQAYLEDLDCETLAAYDGQQALDMIAQNPPDLVLLDIMMPKMSGFEVCKRVHNYGYSTS
jgi:CheY-like chemotaxis protein